MGNIFDEFLESTDISDELIKAIRADFAAELGDSSKSLGKLVKKIENDKHSDLGDVSRFSAECGQALARAIAKNVTPEVQADFAFTYEVANRILQSTLHDNYELIDAAAAAVQERLDAQQNIHIAPQKADFPEKRIEHIAYAAADKTASPDTLRRRLDSPVRNVTESFYTDYVKENAELRSQAGLAAFVVRQTNGSCCPWCASIAGRYEYPDVPKEIWGFHDNCTCSVLYSSAKTTSVHSRKNRPGRKLEGKEREQAIRNAAKPTKFTKEQAKNLQDSVLGRLSDLISAETVKITDKGVHNDYTVDRKLVNSKLYHDKFENITSHKTVNEQLYTWAKKILEKRDGTDGENITILDARTGNMLASNIESTVDNQFKTGLTKEEYQKVVDSNSDFVILHNHPGSTRPSGTDIITLWKEPRAKASIVIGHDGTVYSISKINRKIPLDKIYSEAYNNYKSIGYSDTQAKIKATDVLYKTEAFIFETR